MSSNKSKNFYDITKLFLAYPRTQNLDLKDDLDVNKCFYQCKEENNKVICDMSECKNKLKEIYIHEPKVKKFCENIMNDLKNNDNYLQHKFDGFQIFFRPNEINNFEVVEDISQLKAYHVINLNRKDSDKNGRTGVIELNRKRLDEFQ